MEVPVPTHADSRSLLPPSGTSSSSRPTLASVSVGDDGAELMMHGGRVGELSGQVGRSSRGGRIAAGKGGSGGGSGTADDGSTGVSPARPASPSRALSFDGHDASARILQPARKPPLARLCEGMGMGGALAGVRGLVSKKKRRFNENGFDLDLTCVVEAARERGWAGWSV